MCQWCEHKGDTWEEGCMEAGVIVPISQKGKLRSCKLSGSVWSQDPLTRTDTHSSTRTKDPSKGTLLESPPLGVSSSTHQWLQTHFQSVPRAPPADVS